MAPDFPYEVAVLRITVAALMTTPWIARHLADVAGVERVIIPGLEGVCTMPTYTPGARAMASHE